MANASLQVGSLVLRHSVDETVAADEADEVEINAGTLPLVADWSVDFCSFLSFDRFTTNFTLPFRMLSSFKFGKLLWFGRSLQDSTVEQVRESSIQSLILNAEL